VRDDHRLADAGVTGQRALDLRGLNPETADLDLPVRAPGDLQLLVTPPAAHISRPVHPAARRRAVRVRQEPFGGEVRPAQVAPADAAAADKDLAGHAPRHPGQVLVEHEGLRVRDRAAHGQRAGLLPGGQIRTHVGQGGRDRCLGQPVRIDQPGSGRHAHGRRTVLPAGRVAASDHEPDGLHPLVIRLGEREHLMPVRGGQVDDGDPLLRDVAEKVGGRDRASGRQHQGGSAEQGDKDLLYRRIKAEGSQLQDPVPGGDLVLPGELLADAREGSVADGDRLGTAG
jgi:hypothetical protein